MASPMQAREGAKASKPHGRKGPLEQQQVLNKQQRPKQTWNVKE